MKQDTNMEHSAEWLRGAVAALEEFRTNLTVTTIELEADYRQRLAATEAREAGEPSAAEVIRVAKAALEDCRGNVANHPDGHHKQFIRSEEMAEKALAAIAAWEAGNVQG